LPLQEVEHALPAMSRAPRRMVVDVLLRTFIVESPFFAWSLSKRTRPAVINEGSAPRFCSFSPGEEKKRALSPLVGVAVKPSATLRLMSRSQRRLWGGCALRCWRFCHLFAVAEIAWRGSRRPGRRVGVPRRGPGNRRPGQGRGLGLGHQAVGDERGIRTSTPRAPRTPRSTKKIQGTVGEVDPNGSLSCNYRELSRRLAVPLRARSGSIQRKTSTSLSGSSCEVVTAKVSRRSLGATWCSWCHLCLLSFACRDGDYLPVP
jgi:hypothetical protein